MKHWFCGFVTQDNNSLTKLPKPLSGKLLWRGKNYLWICGNWKKEQVITVSEYLTQMAIVGSCLASHETVIKLFQKAVKEGEYSQLMKLPGNYNLIIQDNIDTYIFVDAAGIKSAFYAVYNSVIVYSSLGIAIQELLKSELDQSWLATFLTGMGTLSLVQKRTPFCDVQPIPAGHYLHISSGKLRCNRYWYKPQEYKAFPDAAQDLREQLLTAVEGRVYLYGNISSDLSGGFDSTTLALIAARYLASQDKQLMTITEKTFSATQSSDVKYAQQAASLYPNINAVMIEEHELPSEYSGLESVPLIDAPDPLVLDMTRTNYVMKIIKSTGSQLHLNGEGGDVVLSSTYCYCVNLLKRVQVVTFLQHIYGWSRLENCSTFSLIRDFINLSFGSYRSWLFQEIKKIQVNNYLHKTTNNLLTTEQFIGWDSIPEFMSWHTNKVVDIVLEELYKWVIIAAPFANTPGEHQTIADIQSMGFTIKAEQQIADIYDIILESPYLDSLVINACLYAKPEERTSPFAYKPLLIKAFQKDFPQNIFIRNTKGDYTADEFADLRKNRTIIKEVLNTSILADMGLIDINKIQTATQSFSMGFLAGLPLFNHTLALEIWLRSFVQKKNSFWLQED
ncbi:albusnodin/ikarugamycin family macrolactam cyclase [Komarekiella sp. 'clone 1']|uniref:asparagine synthase (glutamine-hydrolyzing) n=1 Tax=Komarekiella delphini-convector SJRDD-AB1 TaxID=2593771 RepID=A0AA40SYI8_9NOST|nr:albusnodin/ikarugamycin family macrolactam cyclase [Komarekiella delphini-convector]MBD6617648.1 albusnodin/ikarugamycin family macrolactam cyclase [Komarekiella delphini-convector SJRDD-AB1]